MNVPESITIVDLAVLAVTLFVGYRLYLVLGTRTGHEKSAPPQPLDQNGTTKSEESDITTTAADFQVKEPYAQALQELKTHDPTFDLQTFKKGASNAFEAILNAFVAGDKGRIKNLVTTKVYNELCHLIDEREKSKQRAELPYFRMKDAAVESIQLTGVNAQIAVCFESEQTMLVYEGDKLIEGHDEYVETVHDIWVFKRALTQQKPQWLLEKMSEASS